MVKKIEIVYNYETDETSIKMSSDFQRTEAIHRLDAIQDGLFLLQNLYEKQYQNFINVFGEKPESSRKNDN